MAENDDTPEGAPEETPAHEDAAAPEAAPDAAAAEASATEGEETAAPEAEAPILPPHEVRAILEALIFASPHPVTPREIGKVLAGVPKESWQSALEDIRTDYGREGRGLQLVDVAGGFQITTRAEFNDWVRELLDPKSPTRLSIQALETLAVVAYKQPVTLPEIIELRGIKSGGVLTTLLGKRLIRIVGRKEVVGRPILYGTTKEFLLHFGLKDLSELPKVEEFAEVLGEEVDVVGLKRAIEAPRPVEVPLSEEDTAQSEAEAVAPEPPESRDEER